MKMKISMVPMLHYGGTNTTVGPVFLFRVKTFLHFIKQRSLSKCFALLHGPHLKRPSTALSSLQCALNSSLY